MENPINSELLKVAIYCFSAVYIVGFIAFAVIGGIAFWNVKSGAGKSFGLLFERGNFLRIATVIFIVFAVVLLSLLDALNEGAVAVLSGVTGYVLGGLEKNKDVSYSQKESE